MASAIKAATGVAVKFAGMALSDTYVTALVECEVTIAMHRTGGCRMVFEDRDGKLLDSSPTVGDTCDVALSSEDGPTDVFHGHVTAVGIRQDAESGLREVLIEAQDLRYRFSSTSSIEAVLKRKTTDLVAAIAGDHDLTAKMKASVDPAWEVFLRHASDRDVLDQLATLTGDVWWVDGKNLHFGPRDAKGAKVALDMKSGDLLQFSAKYDGSQVPSSVTHHGNEHGSLATNTAKGEAKASSTTLLAGTEVAFVDGQIKGAIRAGLPLERGTVAPAASADLRTASESELRRRGAMGLRVSGTTWGDARLRPGGMADVKGVGKLAGAYVITEVVHLVRRTEPLTTAFLSETPRRRADSGSPDAGWGQQGPVIGVVTKVEKGLVTVRFPSLKDSESAPARMVAVGAGKDRGMDFLPEVNDEVLVAFEHGDLRYPLILGGLWNSDSTAPTEGDQTQRVIRSKEGHELIFDEAEKSVSLNAVDAKTGMVIDQPGKKMTFTMPAGSEIKLIAGKTILTLSDTAGLKLETNGKAIIDAKQDTQIKGLNVKVESGANMDLKAGANGTLKSGAIGTVQAGAVQNVKGAMVKLN